MTGQGIYRFCIEGLLKKLGALHMCTADVHICQFILIVYAWLKIYVVRILGFFNKPSSYFDAFSCSEI
jgi:hypothetical protein